MRRNLDPNRDIVTGERRPLNLQLEPFRLSTALAVINEGEADPFGYYDRIVALWRVSDLPAMSAGSRAPHA